MHSASRIAAVLIIVSSPLAATGKVWRVSQNDPTADFTSIQAGVDAATDGDTVLVQPIVPVAKGQPTSYDGFVVNGKSLTFAADEPPFAGAIDTPVVGGEILIYNLAAGNDVVLRGFHVGDGASLFGFATTTLTIRNNDGGVFIEDTTVDQVFTTIGLPVVTVQDSAVVVFNNCRLESLIDPPIFPSLIAGEPALHATDSSIYLYDSEVFGGNGASSPFFPEGGVVQDPSPGAAGIRMEGGFLLISGSEVRGGKGGSGATIIGCKDSADGGHGVLVLAGLIPPVVRVLDSVTIGGAGGAPGVGCSAGVDGMGIGLWTAIGDVQLLSGQARSATISSPETEGHQGTLTFKGEPGDLVFAAVSIDSAPAYIEPWFGLIITPIDSHVFALGTADGTGALVQSYVAPTLPVLLESETIHVQTVSFTPGTQELRVAPPSWLTVLDG